MWHRVDMVLTDVSEERLPLTSLTDASRADFLIISLLPWRWRRYVPPKRRLTPYLHGATSQKTAFFKYNEIREHSNVCDAFPTQNGLKQEAAFLQIRFNFNKRH
jgi:hypothetical protein